MSGGVARTETRRRARRAASAGVVAAGDPDTARAAVDILRKGGNAADAAIAACAASFIAEPILASPGGGGIMTLAMPGMEPVGVDFFADMPGRGAAGAGDAHSAGSAASAGGSGLDFWAIHINFGPAQQEFHIGRGSAAVPGVFPGLALAHTRFGSLPLTDLMAPAIALASQGVEVHAGTLRVFDLVWPIVATDPDTARVIGVGHKPIMGDRLRNPDLGAVLAEFAALGRTPDRFNDGLLEWFGPRHGGLITESDLAAYRPRVAPPRQETFADWTVHVPAAPGGHLALTILHELARTGRAEHEAASEASEILRYARASRAGHAERQRIVTPGGPGSTTHISVIDAAGGAVSVTLTNGEGCGYLVPGTGIQINNFLGEEDLNPAGFHCHAPGQRLPTMIAPAVGVRHGVPALALGSGGSNRIRSAVGEVLYRVVVLGQGIEEAVFAPRVHAEGDVVWVELEGVADVPAATAALASDFATVHCFAARDFFFGGVHAVALDADSQPHGIGDPRRSGASFLAPVG